MNTFQKAGILLYGACIYFAHENGIFIVLAAISAYVFWQGENIQQQYTQLKEMKA